MKKIAFTLLVIVWMGVIFAFSSQNGDNSSKSSSRITKIVVKYIEKIKDTKLSDEKKDTVDYIVRKIAHFTEYFILAILVFLMLKEYKISYIYLWTILVCFLYASTDEFHQLFVGERAGQPLDVLIDTSGSIVAVLIISILLIPKKKKHK